MTTYNVPWVSEVAVGAHKKSHCNNLQKHFQWEHRQEQVVAVGVVPVGVVGVIQREHNRVQDDTQDNEAVKPGVGHDFYYKLADWVCHRAAAEGDGRVVPLRVNQVVVIFLHAGSHSFCHLAVVAGHSEYFVLLLLQPHRVILLALGWIMVVYR